MRSFKIMILTMLICLTSIAAILLALNIYYKDKFTGETIVNGVDMTNKSFNEVISYIDGIENSYELNVESINGHHTLKSTDIGYQISIEDDLKDILDKQNEIIWPFRLINKQKNKIDLKISYDESKLTSAIKRSGITNSGNKEMQDAYISSELNENNEYYIIPEVYGNIPIIENIYNEIKSAISNNDTYVNLIDTCYEQPNIKSDNEELVNKLNELNNMTNYDIQYDVNGKSFKFDRAYLLDYVTLSEETGDYSVNLSLAKDNFISKLNKELTTLGYGIEFKTTLGNIKDIPGGNWGWWLDREKTREKLDELVSIGGEQAGEVYWRQTAPLYGEKEFINYVEIDLGNQHLYMYKNRELLGDWDIVSGLDGDPNRKTPEGIYIMTYKETDRILRGTGYASHVDYWMPFNGGISMHDASWQPSFGGDIYKWRGSHGCINMPLDGAKTVYENLDKSYAIICYY